MKKLFIIFMILAFTLGTAGCGKHPAPDLPESANSGDNSEQNSPAPSEESEGIRLLTSGNQQGYYMVESSAQGSHSNLMYIDYSTQQKIFLCAKPNCSHNDNTCTSFLEEYGVSSTSNSSYSVFCTDDCLYLFYGSSGMSMFFSGAAPTIYRIDLNGENRQVIYEADSGAEINLQYGCYADGNYIYFLMKKTGLSDPDKNGVIEMSSGTNSFVRLNLKSGKTEDVMNLQNRNLLTAYETNLILSETDPMPDNITDIDKIDQYLQNQEVRILLFEPDSKKETLLYTATAKDELWNCVLNDDRLLFVSDNTIQSLDLRTGNAESITEKRTDSVSIQGIYDRLLYFEERNNQNIATIYGINLNTKEISHISLMTNEPGAEPVIVIAEAGNDYLVNHRCDRTRNQLDSVIIDENGVEHKFPDYTVNKQYYALIAKSDYQNSNAEYREITEG